MKATRIILAGCALLAAIAPLAGPPREILGFRSLRWGDPASALGRSARIRPELSISPHKRIGEDLSVLGERAESISYDFDLKTGGLMGVSVFFIETPGMCERLATRLAAEYGPWSHRSPEDGAPRKLSWEQPSGSVTLECANGKEEPRILTVDFDEG